MNVRRFPQNPMIRPHMDSRMGGNINGPSLVRVPEGTPGRLGRYYLYFAHHQGAYIRMAYADALEGPWTIFTPGVLAREDTVFGGHIASPDVHVLPGGEFRMYFHGCRNPEAPPVQSTQLAVSEDGLYFRVATGMLGASYWRVFRWKDAFYTLEMPGVFRRSRDGVKGWERGPTLFSPAQRHSAVEVRGSKLDVYYSNAGDCPERILRARIDLEPDWMEWKSGPPEEVLRPEFPWEGVDEPLVPSRRGSSHEPVRQLRDPCVFREDGRLYLLYSVAGESGIAVAEIEETTTGSA